MRALLDTCVLSELVRPRGSKLVKARGRALPRDETYLSVITICELARGIALLPTGKQRTRYARSLDQLEQGYAESILPIDVDTGRIWGEIDAARKRAGRPIGAPDGLIAATAKRHGLQVVTRNVRDFEDTGVLLLDLWEKIP